jgi:arsenate reductase
MALNAPLNKYVSQATALTAQLSEERKAKLAVLSEYIQGRRAEGAPIALNFICTHNSRRSHLGQLWAAVAAYVHGVPGVTTYSGGTEATAFNPRAVAAIERAGFEVKHPGGENPLYEVRFASDAPACICFSKCYDDASNPCRRHPQICADPAARRQ